MGALAERSEGSLYEHDFYAWTRQQAALIAAGRYSELDVVNLLDEIESLGHQELSSLRLNYENVAIIFLRWSYAPNSQLENDRVELVRARIDIEHSLEDNPSIKDLADEIFLQAYEDACKVTAAYLDLPSETFPTDPPFDREQLQAYDWYPTSAADHRPDYGQATSDRT